MLHWPASQGSQPLLVRRRRTLFVVTAYAAMGRRRQWARSVRQPGFNSRGAHLFDSSFG